MKREGVVEESDNDEGIPIYLSRTGALKIADFLDAYGEDDDYEIAANIRYQAKGPSE